MDIIDQAISAISAGDALLAGFVLEKALKPNTDNGATMGWPPELASYHVTMDDRYVIENALAEFVESNLNDSVISSAVWALGKSFNPDYQRLFENVLRTHVSGDPVTLFQAMIALDNLGTCIKGADRSLSITQSARNQELSRRYLSTIFPNEFPQHSLNGNNE